MEWEKELIDNELSEGKEKLKKMVDEKKQWEKEKSLLIEKVTLLKEKQFVLEKEMEDKNKENGVQVIHSIAQTSTESIVQAMS